MTYSSVLKRLTGVTAAAMLSFSAQSAPITMDFSNACVGINCDPSWGVGTTDPWMQNGVTMSVVQGSYEIVGGPFYEMNLKNFFGIPAPDRTVEFMLDSGLNFDFLGSTGGGFPGDPTIIFSSSKGGTGAIGDAFSGDLWQDLAWVRVTKTGLGEAKFTSFSFDNEPTRTVPLPATAWLFLPLLLCVVATSRRQRVAA